VAEAAAVDVFSAGSEAGSWWPTVTAVKNHRWFVDLIISSFTMKISDIMKMLIQNEKMTKEYMNIFSHVI
jgi:hypothetical protein